MLSTDFLLILDLVGFIYAISSISKSKPKVSPISKPKVSPISKPKVSPIDNKLGFLVTCFDLYLFNLTLLGSTTISVVLLLLSIKIFFTLPGSSSFSTITYFFPVFLSIFT